VLASTLTMKEVEILQTFGDLELVSKVRIDCRFTMSSLDLKVQWLCEAC